jgi:hydroxyethylthiazole kinase-like uncharacterized protein yjeF
MSEIDRDWLAAHPLPQPGPDTDKNKRGHVVAAGGSQAVPGALRLTGEAAFRAGAGKVQLATVEQGSALLGVALPEAAVFALPVNRDGELAARAGKALAGMLGRCDTVVLGPGMGAGADCEAILEAVLAHPRGDLTLLIDAAMIAAAAQMEQAVRGYAGRVVFTPHPGEMALLMACDEDRVAAQPEALAREAAARFGATIVLKSSETWIATPDAPILHYPGGGPGLATGGSGDVLAGIIGGLLSRGAPPRIAAAWGVWLHGEAGKALSARIGPLGFLARELPAEVPALMAAAG